VKEEKKSLLVKYLICLVVASAIMVIVFAINGFFTDDLRVNFQILTDGLTVSGLLLLLFAGLMFISREGALLGIGYVMRNVVLAFIPMGRTKHETYAQYRERKLGISKKPGDRCVTVTGAVFMILGIICLIIWQNL